MEMGNTYLLETRFASSCKFDKNKQGKVFFCSMDRCSLYRGSRAAADVGKAAVVAGLHQVAKAAVQSKTPQVKASDVQKAIKPPPTPHTDEKLY